MITQKHTEQKNNTIPQEYINQAHNTLVIRKKYNLHKELKIIKNNNDKLRLNIEKILFPDDEMKIFNIFKNNTYNQKKNYFFKPLQQKLLEFENFIDNTDNSQEIIQKFNNLFIKQVELNTLTISENPMSVHPVISIIITMQNCTNIIKFFIYYTNEEKYFLQTVFLNIKGIICENYQAQFLCKIIISALLNNGQLQTEIKKMLPNNRLLPLDLITSNIDHFCSFDSINKLHYHSYDFYNYKTYSTIKYVYNTLYNLIDHIIKKKIINKKYSFFVSTIRNEVIKHSKNIDLSIKKNFKALAQKILKDSFHDKIKNIQKFKKYTNYNVWLVIKFEILHNQQNYNYEIYFDCFNNFFVTDPNVDTHFLKFVLLYLFHHEDLEKAISDYQKPSILYWQKIS